MKKIILIVVVAIMFVPVIQAQTSSWLLNGNSNALGSSFIGTTNNVPLLFKTNKHLPDVPSAEEVEQGGVDLGEMNAVLLQKIEEMTLYIIDLQKQIDELKTKGGE